MELIDRNYILSDKLTHTLPPTTGKASGKIVVFADDIENAPIVDAVPAVHGHWIGKGYDECSMCGGMELGRTNYCPNCGADMRERKTDDCT